jgi:tRNA U54 and U55 pseudouridine synthase Pus10
MIAKFVERQRDCEEALTRLRLEREEIDVRMLALAKPLALAIEREKAISAKVEKIGVALSAEMNAGKPAVELREQWAAQKTELVEARSEIDRLSRAGRQLGERLEAIASEVASWTARRDQAVQQCKH